jgi:hypothetical protein
MLLECLKLLENKVNYKTWYNILHDMFFVGGVLMIINYRPGPQQDLEEENLQQPAQITKFKHGIQP